MPTSAEISPAAASVAGRPLAPGVRPELAVHARAAETATDGLRLGIVNPETWQFLHELHRFLAARHETANFARRAISSPVFRERLERVVLARDLRRFMRRCDVAFFEWASDLLVLASGLPKTCPIVVRLHRYELYSWARLVNWDAVDRVVLVSEAKRREFSSLFPPHAHKTEVVPVGVCTDRFAFVDRPFTGTIGTLCHLSPRKRIYDLILALAPMLQTRPWLHLSIGGDVDPHHADYYEAVQRLVRRLDLEDRVRFDGPVTNPAAWYRDIDIFISHSYSEGLQVAPMEAMATGCHTLVHEWAGADELVPADCLYLTNVDLVARIEALARLSDDERRNARMRMRRFVVERFAAVEAHVAIDRILRESAAATSRVDRRRHL